MNGWISTTIVSIFLISITGTPAFAAVFNIGLDGGVGGHTVANDLFAFTVFEGRQGNTDLNGDGDTTDSIIHVLNTKTRIVTNTATPGFTIGNHVQSIDGNLILFSGNEFQANTDYNSDGDIFDFVNLIYDTNTGTITSSKLSGAGDIEQNKVLISVSESNQGETDLNGDGDALDTILHVFDAGTGTTINVGVDAPTFLRDENYATFGVFESRQGVDLNGDGDLDDTILHAYDISTNTLSNIGKPVFGVNLNSNVISMLVLEPFEGIDLNGDGDLSDRVLHVHDIDSGITTNVGLASGFAEIDGSNLIFAVAEHEQGNTDLNGDGITIGSVYHIYNTASKTTTNLGLAVDHPSFVIEGNFAAFNVYEPAQGSTDLNGDGDVSDSILFVHNIASGTSTNLGLDVFFPDLNVKIVGDNLFILVEEVGTDLNGDGDDFDYVPHVYETQTGITTNIGIASSDSLKSDGRFFTFIVNEFEVGDLNGDGDDFDEIPHVYDFLTKITTNLATESENFAIDTGVIMLSTSEENQGNTDLNGDGDTEDFVIQQFTLDSDGDGIDDSVDADPNNPSNDFSDGTTFGTITAGNAFLTIVDDPTNGVIISATGNATVSACGIVTIELTAGDSIKVTCGSATIEVLAGTVEVTFEGTVTVLNAGESTTFGDDSIDDRKKSCDALEKAETNGQGKHKGIEKAKENNDC